MITVKTRLNAVIGFPIGHSKSPVLHNALYQKLGIDAVMLAFAHKDARMLALSIRALNVGLTAVTMPFKQAIIPLLDKTDAVAKAMNSVNTVINKNGRLVGYNTDIDGIDAALKGVAIKNKTVLVIGAGGAARAVAYFIKTRGGKALYLNRTPSAARQLQKKFGGAVVKPDDARLKLADVVINTTPIGMHPASNQTPMPGYVFKKHQHVFDLVYNPRQTKLLTDAKKAGARTISGVEMFVGQALRQVELFSGKKLSGKRIKSFVKDAVIKSL